MEDQLHRLADRASDIHGRVVRGASSEFERARVLRDLQQLTIELHTAARQVGELGRLIMAAGEDGPNSGGGRAA